MDLRMWVRQAINVFSIFIIIGFILGTVFALDYILANRYIQYEMIRMVVLGFQENLNKWVIQSILLFVVSLLFLLAVKFICKVLFSKLIEIHLKNEYWMLRVYIAFIACSVLLFCGIWAISHYWLSEKHLLINLLVYAGILFFIIGLGVILIRIKWENILNSKGMRRLALGLIILVVIINFIMIMDSKINSPEGPNVLFIVVDTLRADHLSCHGYSRKISPNIDNLSLNSILFKNAIAPAPWTTPSIGSIFTSQYPATLGVDRELSVRLNSKFLTLAEVFKGNNYKTKGIISHAYISSQIGFDQGFDSYDEENAKGHGHISSPSITKKAVSFLEKHKSDRFFLFLHYFDPHFDYILHENYDYCPEYNGHLHSGQSIKVLHKVAPYMSTDDIKYLVSLYDSEIAFTDEYTGKLLDKLKEFGLDDNTLIIFTSDHGEEFLERGDYWIGHTKKLYQEQIHVPLIIKLPGSKNRDIIEEYFGLIELMPVIIHQAGLKIPGSYRYEARITDLKDAEGLKNRKIISETRKLATLQSVIWKDWKLIYNPKNHSKELFNLKVDPKESENLATENEEVLKEMEKILENWEKYANLKRRETKPKQAKFTKEQLEQLKSLGYIK